MRRFPIVLAAQLVLTSSVIVSSHAQTLPLDLAVLREWSPTETYNTNDLVVARGSTWLSRRNANKNRVPGQTNPSTAPWWRLAARGFNPIGAWSTNTKYQPDDLVTYQGQTWRALVTNKQQQPATGAIWELLAVKGARGDAGAEGPRGLQGLQGPAGAVGLQGAQGPAGPQGAMGSAGAQGALGAQGPPGPQGSTGPAGAAGEGLTWQGVWSAASDYAAADAVQYSGRAYVAIQASTVADPKNPETESTYWSMLAAGPRWRSVWSSATTYDVNDTVSRGGSSYIAIQPSANEDPQMQAAFWALVAVKGDQGDVGLQGATGTNGATGAQGPAGPQGAHGDPGPQGPAGTQGPVGAAGAQGLAGPPGAQGVAGTQGIQGDPGPQGATGLQGPQGPAGPNTIANGSVAAPSLNFATSASTGIFAALNGEIGLAVSGQPFLHRGANASAPQRRTNTALGTNAFNLTASSASDNTAIGADALTNGSGSNNTAIGSDALASATSGGSNVAVGSGTLGNTTTGSSNVAIGNSAGNSITTGSNNIYIGQAGSSNTSNQIRIGNASHTATYVTGISGTTVTGAAVLVQSDGRLGVVLSSQRYKKDIAPMPDMTAILGKLRPVTFRYKQPHATDDSTLQYGLIAEQVAEVFPDLTLFNKNGTPETVSYHELPSILLAGWQAQQKTITAQAAKIDALEERLRKLEALLPQTKAASLQ